MSSDQQSCQYCPMSNHVTLIRSSLFNAYSSSQNYYYTKDLNDIVEEALSPANIRFEDDQYYDDFEEFLKRSYAMHEYPLKLQHINQYYYYHRDAPRLYLGGLSKAYNRWQDRRKSFLYRKLKKMLNEPESNSESAGYENQYAEAGPHVTHILLDISQYNPYSKKYYLRKKQKVQEKRKEDSQVTQNIVESLRLVLSKCSSLSSLSFRSDLESPSGYKTSRIEPSQTTRDTRATTKFDFKKKKITIERTPSKDRKQSIQNFDSEQKRQSTMLAFRKSQQQIVINQSPMPRKSVPIISVSTGKKNQITQNTRSSSLKNVRIRAHINVNSNQATKKQSAKPKPKLLKNSSRQFCDQKMMQNKVQSYKSQQIMVRVTPPRLSLGTLNHFGSAEIPRNDETMRKILLMRYEGK